MIRQVLLPIAGSGFDAVAVRHAVDLAERHDAAIRVLQWTVCGSTRSQRMRSDTMEQIDDLAEVIGLRLNPPAAGDDVARFVNMHAHHEDLIVVGLRGVLEAGGMVNWNALFDAIRMRAVPLIATPDYYHPVYRAVVATDQTAMLVPVEAVSWIDSLQLGPIEQVTIALFVESRDTSRDSRGIASPFHVHGLRTESVFYSGNLTQHLSRYVDASDADLVVLDMRKTLVNGDAVGLAETVWEAERMLLLLPAASETTGHGSSGLQLEPVSS